MFFLSCRNITFINTTDFICYKKIILRTGKNIVAEFKRKHLVPSEMEKIIINKSLLENIKGDLVVSLEDGE